MPEADNEKPRPTLLLNGKPLPEGEVLEGGAGGYTITRLPNGSVARTIAQPDSIRKGRMEREIQHLKKADHHGIIPLLDLVTSGDHHPVGYTMPGVIFDMFWRGLYPDGLTVELLLRHAFQLLNIVIHLQEDLNCVHGDIKPANIGFVRNENGSYQLILIDWEMVCPIGSRPLGDPEEDEPDEYDPDPPPMRLAMGTPAFMSPEHAMGMTFGTGVDPLLILLTLLSIITMRQGYIVGRNDDQALVMYRAATVDYPHWEIVKRRLPVPPLLSVFNRGMQERYCDGRFMNPFQLKEALVRVHHNLTHDEFSFILS